MLLALLLALAPLGHAAPPPLAPPAPVGCGAPVFTFVGQPACVSLAFDGARTQLVNGCGAPLLVDASVLAGAGVAPGIPAGGRAELRDLSAFSLGLEGEIHRAVAVVEVTACPAPGPVAGPPAPVRGAWLQAVLAFMRIG